VPAGESASIRPLVLVIRSRDCMLAFERARLRLASLYIREGGLFPLHLDRPRSDPKPKTLARPRRQGALGATMVMWHLLSGGAPQFTHDRSFGPADVAAENGGAAERAAPSSRRRRRPPRRVRREWAAIIPRPSV
jgi:hypothetical protein